MKQFYRWLMSGSVTKSLTEMLFTSFASVYWPPRGGVAVEWARSVGLDYAACVLAR